MFEREIAQLARAVRHEVTTHKQANSIATRRIVRIRRRDFTLKYSEDLDLANLSRERIEEDTWEERDQERFREGVVRGLEEYKLLATALGTEATTLETFVRTLCYASFRGLDDGQLQQRADTFARLLGNQPLPVKVTAFIDGVSIVESPLVISDKFVLRRPTPEDLTESISVDDYGGFSFPLQETWFRVVGDLTFDAISPGIAQEEFLRTVDALRLFRVGGIRANRYRMSSWDHMGTMTVGGGPGHSFFSYSLSRIDANELNAFLHHVVPLLPNAFHSDEPTAERVIAYTRYRDALFQAGAPDQVITWAITALEALFLEGDLELKHRLAQRVSVFLRALGTQPDAQRTYQQVDHGYKIRSKFIHGGSLPAGKRSKADSLAQVLLGYARECVLAFFQMSIPKPELVMQLDRTMVDPASAKELEASLSTVVHH